MSHLFLIVGPSGSGKTTIMRSLMSNEIVSYTTRERRKNEVDGKDYIFIGEDEFRLMHDSGQLIESTKYSGNYYGLSYSEVEEKLRKGDAFAIVDFNGMCQLKGIYPNCTSIFIRTTKDHARMAMFERGDSFAKINDRLYTFYLEQDNAVKCDYVIRNEYGQPDKALTVVKSIIEAHSESPKEPKHDKSIFV